MNRRHTSETNSLMSPIDHLAFFDSLSFRFILCFLISSLCIHSLRLESALAVSKLTIVLKPRVFTPSYHVGLNQRVIHFSSIIRGSRGEPISNVQVDLSHQCLLKSTIISGFDGVLQASLVPFPDSSMSSQCRQWWQRLEHSQRSVFLSHSFSSAEKESGRVTNEALSWDEQSNISLFKKQPFKLVMKVYESPVNSAQSLVIDVEQEPSLLIIQPTLSMKTKSGYEPLVHTKLTFLPNLPTQRMGPLFNEKELTFDYQLSKQTSTGGNQLLEVVESKREKLSFRTLKGWETSSLSPLEYFNRYTVSIRVAIPVDLDLMKDVHDDSSLLLKSERSSSWTAVTKLDTMNPQLFLDSKQISSPLFDHRLELEARLRVDRSLDDQKRVNAYIKEVIKNDRVQVLLSWRTRDAEGIKGQWQSQHCSFNEKGDWSKLLILPRRYETQLKLELMYRDSDGEWIQKGHVQLSDWLSSPLDGLWWPLMTVFSLVLFWVIYHLRTRLPIFKLSITDTVIHREALKVTRLTSTERDLLDLSKVASIVILDAITQGAIEGSISSIQVQRLGGPLRWEHEFQNLISKTVQRISIAGENLSIEPNSYLWVTADGYEPLLVHVPEGEGCLMLPLWPARDALGRMWSDCLTVMGVKQKFGRGDLRSLKHHLRAIGDVHVMTIADQIEKSLFNQSPVNQQVLYGHLRQLQALIKRSTFPAQLARLYPPSDFMRGQSVHIDKDQITSLRRL